MSTKLLKSKMTKIANRVDAITDETSTVEIEDLIKCLEEALVRLENAMGDADEEQSEYDRYEQRYFDSKQKLLKILDKRKNNERVGSDNVESLQKTQQEIIKGLKDFNMKGNQEIRLPRIEIPRFSGEFENWCTFKDLYMGMVDENEQLSNIQKHHYLRTLLTGEALSLLKHIPLTADNYVIAWGEIKKRYDRPFLIIRALISKFLNTDEVNFKLNNIRKTYSQFSETIGVLRQMGDYASSVDPWLIHFMTMKLDPESKKYWAEECILDKEPSVDSFLQFFEDRCRASEILSNEKGKNTKTFSAFTLSCFYCKEEHSIHKCNSFRDLGIQEKENILKYQGRCFRCFKKGHNSGNCTTKFKCQICQNKHHTFLHKEKSKTNKPLENEKIENIAQVKFGKIKQSTSILPTALVKISDAFGNQVKCRALLDSGSQDSFITENLCKKLSVRKRNVKIPFEGINSDKISYSSGQVDLVIESCTSSAYRFAATLNVISGSIGDIPATRLNNETIDELSAFELADSSFFRPTSIDILLSANTFFNIIGTKKFYHRKDSLWIHESRLGYIICGGGKSSDESILSGGTFLKTVNDEVMNAQFERLWEIDDSPSTIEDQSEIRCEEMYASNVKRQDSGRYVVKLPFRGEENLLGGSLMTAQKRFYYLEKKFARDNEFRSSYCDFMRDYLAKGHMERVPLNEIDVSDNLRYYLPHHGVFHQNGEKRKLRVVFDASAKTSSGISLNDVLLPGPNLQSLLTDILTRFRFHKWVFMADIQQMYRQILVTKEDQNFQRIVWRESSADRLEHFRLKTVTYGTNCAPYLAIRTLRRLATDEYCDYPKAASVLRENVYMDDILVGSEDVNHLKTLKSELIGLLSKGMFVLKKWASNCEDILVDINEADKIKTFSFCESDDCLIKTLGIQWSPMSDSFTFKVENCSNISPTKRNLLSEMARLYDPFGWVAPVTISLKILFQETWAAKYEWDQEISDPLRSRWFRIRSELNLLSLLRIDRWFGDGLKYELHGFSDASERAFSAVIYLRVINSDIGTRPQLIACKTKVSPLKAVSIARLELCAAHLLTKLVNAYKNVIDGLVSDYYLWTDSTIVLAWLSAPPRKWKTFVANRTSQISSLCPNIKWRHVSFKENPADIPSRGILPSELIKNNLWWHGPSWLNEWLPATDDSVNFESVEELRIQRINMSMISDQFWPSLFNRFSSFRGLRNCIAYWLRFLKNRNPKNTKICGPLTASELQSSINFLIRRVQAAEFGTEVRLLYSKNKIHCKSKLLKFNPYLDENKILRVGGRLQNSQLDGNAKHPILIPKGRFSELLIVHTHNVNFHAGQRLVLSLLRSGYWIFGLQSSIKKYIRNCKSCILQRARTFQPQLGPLPVSRVTPSKPFQTVGLDFAGPITLRPYKGRGKLNVKGYFALFICLCTKAIHLELVMGLSTESLLMALKRFLARRGKCSEIWSDNGRNFSDCNQMLIKFYKEIAKSSESEDIKRFVAENMIAWRFIPAYSPHFGGIWEAGVKSVKTLLSRTFRDQILTIEEFQTSLCQIESLLNSRPLTVLSDDPEIDILTPGHFLVGSSQVDVPLSVGSLGDFCLVERYKLIQNLVNGFWKKWRSEYLSYLNFQSKWFRTKTQPSVGDIVVIKRAASPPSLWLKGRIKRLYPGVDGIVRVVDVQTTNGVRREAIRNLIPFELNSDGSTGGVCSTKIVFKI